MCSERVWLPCPAPFHSQAQRGKGPLAAQQASGLLLPQCTHRPLSGKITFSKTPVHFCFNRNENCFVFVFVLNLAGLIQVPLLSVTDGKLASSRRQVCAARKLPTQMKTWLGAGRPPLSPGRNQSARNPSHFSSRVPLEPTSLLPLLDTIQQGVHSCFSGYPPRAIPLGAQAGETTGSTTGASSYRDMRRWGQG